MPMGQGHHPAFDPPPIKKIDSKGTVTKSTNRGLSLEVGSPATAEMGSGVSPKEALNVLSEKEKDAAYWAPTGVIGSDMQLRGKRGMKGL